MHNGRIKMTFVGFSRFKRNFVCPECGVRCGIERRCRKVPFCCGTHHVFQIKERGEVRYVLMSPNCVYQQPTRQPIDKQTRVTTF